MKKFIIKAIYLSLATTVVGCGEKVYFAKENDIHTGVASFKNYSPRDEINKEIKPRAVAKIEKSREFLSNYVTTVGNRLIVVSDNPEKNINFVVTNYETPLTEINGDNVTVSRGLLKTLFNEAELAAILGHQIAHIQLNQNKQIFTYTQETNADEIALNYMSRAGYNPKAAISLYKRLNKANDKNNKFERIFSIHPMNTARLEEMSFIAEQMPKSLAKSTTSMDKIKDFLSSDYNAEKLFKKSKESLKSKKYPKAKRLADKAIKIEPYEAKFYTLRGDIYLESKQYNKAIESYNQAIQIDKKNWYNFSQRGKAFEKLKLLDKAFADYDHSEELRS